MESRYVPTQGGDELLSVAAAGPPEAQAIAEQLRAAGPWLEVVAGIDSVVVRFDAVACDAAEASRRIEAALAGGIRQLPVDSELLEIPVVYGGDYGPDLEQACRTLGLSADEFVAMHTGSEHHVDMIGFTPGFAYVGGLDKSLRLPRRTHPRQHVPAGSVGIADGRTGLYSLPGPGGWTLVGRTPFRLFEAEADNPFPIRAGMRIRFKAIAPEQWPA